MNGLSAVIFVPDDAAKTGYPQPMMLHRVLGAPLLAWLADAMFAGGVGRFFLVCHDRYVREACACLPEGAEVMTSADSNPADLLHVFLSTAEEAEREITIVAGPALYLSTLTPRAAAPKNACVCRASREALMNALDENFSFSRFLRDNCAVLSDFDGYYTVDSPAAALELAELLRRDQMLRLQKQGVEIFDAGNCYVEPTVRIEAGAKLLPGTVLRGKSLIRAGAVIGPWSVIENSEIGERATVNCSQVTASYVGADATVGPFAHIRPDCRLERGAAAGSFVELKNARLGEDTLAPHLTYLGDAEIGARCNLGCGTATANFDRLGKHQTVVGDDAFIGCNSSLVAPVRIGAGAYVAAGSVITEDVPENALGIARARQSNKKDWAAKHKKEEN